MSEIETEIMKDSIEFRVGTNDPPALTICPNGRFLVNGVLVEEAGEDIKVYNAMKQLLIDSGYLKEG